MQRTDTFREARAAIGAPRRDGERPHSKRVRLATSSPLSHRVDLNLTETFDTTNHPDSAKESSK